MAYLLIRHQVADFACWKSAYDAHAGARQAAGLTEQHLLRSLDNQNEVVVLLAAADLKKAQDFIASPDLREVMQKAGVTDKPDVWFLN